MASLIWNPLWQLSDAEHFDINSDRSVTFKGNVGNIFLPEEYLSFMQKTGGAGLLDRGAWFVAKYPDEEITCEIEWLGKMSTVFFGTWDFYTDSETFHLPEQFVSIGYAEVRQHCSEKYKANHGCNVVIQVDRNSPDYGKVYLWIKPSQSFENVDTWMKGNNTLGLGYIAGSFNDFMNDFKSAAYFGEKLGFHEK